MLKYITRRLLGFVPTLFAIATIVFFLIRLAPGGPFDDERNVSDEVRRNLEAHYNLDAPLYQQYARYLWDVLHGDLGPYFEKPSRTVSEWIAYRFPVSLELGLYGLAVAIVVGLFAGVTASLRPNTLTDHLPMSFAMAGICIPNFVLGPLLVLVLSIYLGWLPVSGWEYPEDKILPAITLGVPYAAYIARLSRGGMLEVLSQDFIRTARAKGLSEARVVLRHALRGGINRGGVSRSGPAGIITARSSSRTSSRSPGWAANSSGRPCTAITP